MAKDKKIRREPSQRLQDWEGDGKIALLVPATALLFAKLLHVGAPPLKAVLYICPNVHPDLLEKVAKVWLGDAEVLRAVEHLNGGAWLDLPKETRLQLALDKHVAEVAYYLWTTNFSDTEHREGLDKMKQAREVLKLELGRQADPDDPMAAFARFALDFARAQDAHKQAEKVAKRPVAPELPTLKM